MLNIIRQDISIIFEIVRYNGESVDDVKQELCRIIGNGHVVFDASDIDLCISNGKSPNANSQIVDESHLFVGAKFQFFNPVRGVHAFRESLRKDIEAKRGDLLQHHAKLPLCLKNPAIAFGLEDESVLHIAAKSQMWPCVLTLLDCGARCPVDGIPIFYYVAQTGDTALITAMLERNVPLNQGYELCSAAIHGAVRSGNLEAVQMLIDAGAVYLTDFSDCDMVQFSCSATTNKQIFYWFWMQFETRGVPFRMNLPPGGWKTCLMNADV